MCESKKDCNLLIPRDSKYRYPTAPIFLPPPFLFVPQGLLFSRFSQHPSLFTLILTEFGSSRNPHLSLSLIVVFWVNFSPIHSFTFPHWTHLIVVPIATASLGQSLLTSILILFDFPIITRLSVLDELVILSLSLF